MKGFRIDGVSERIDSVYSSSQYTWSLAYTGEKGGELNLCRINLHGANLSHHRIQSSVFFKDYQEEKNIVCKLSPNGSAGNLIVSSKLF